MTCNHSHNKTVQCDTCYGNIFSGRQDSGSDEVTSLDDLR